eukprot:4898409-Pleurochrysis_carterae.AAC.1
MPDIQALRATDNADLITFPQCALGASAQKYTTLLATPGISPSLVSLSNLTCQHTTHPTQAGGSKCDDTWTSRSTAAYPPDLNFLLARVIASCRAARTLPSTTID